MEENNANVKKQLEMLTKIRKFAFENIRCTSEIYCENM